MGIKGDAFALIWESTDLLALNRALASFMTQQAISVRQYFNSFQSVIMVTAPMAASACALTLSSPNCAALHLSSLTCL